MSETDPPLLSPAQLELRIQQLDEHIASLHAYDISGFSERRAPTLVALQASIRETLVRCFGHNTPRSRHFDAAGSLYPFGRPTGLFSRRSDSDALLKAELKENFERAIELLRAAQKSLKADLADTTHWLSTPDRDPRSAPLSRRVFVVHGHDDGARETVARFLEKIGFEPIILHEQANQGRTVIEKIEAHGDVNFAVVLLTPDDTGCARGREPEPRARQNVLLELGYFIGRLGRDKVCALKRGEVNIPSDFAGVVWEAMDAGGGWKQSLSRELKAVGHRIDWNLVMES